MKKTNDHTHRYRYYHRWRIASHAFCEFQSNGC